MGFSGGEGKSNFSRAWSNLKEIFSRSKCWLHIVFEGVEEVSSGDHQLFGSLKINFNFGVSFHLSRVLCMSHKKRLFLPIY